MTLAAASLTFALQRGQHVAVYTAAHCPACHRQVMAVPGSVTLDCRQVKDEASRSGRGSVVACKRCKTLVEVIAHR